MILLAANFQDIFTNFGDERMIDFFGRLFASTISVFILIRFIYYPKNGQSEHLFTFFQMGLIVFLIASILDNVKLDFGFALGLFAIFSIIRFRTPPVDMKEITYLFMVIGISIINALVEYQVSDWIGLLFTNIIILSFAYIFEWYKPGTKKLKKALTFKPSGFHILNDNKLLLAEIVRKTSIKATKVEISKINAVKGEVTVWIYFKTTDDKPTSS